MKSLLMGFTLWVTCSFLLAADEITSLTWEMMKTMDYQTGSMPDSMKELNQQIVEVTGFIVPLEMNEYIDTVKEFLLVPDPLACIHVPPPPPNQMVYVRMETAIPLDMDLRGVAIQGELKFIHPEEGVHSFELVGKSAKEANIEYDDPLMDLFY
tara:strand:+ start:253 stop:714 length:462 start_codon:yes stop_codon:yes gene_type:complete